MIRQQFSVNGYWTVIIFYDLDYNLFYIVDNELHKAGMSTRNIERLYEIMYSHKAKAVTYSNKAKHLSIIIFNAHSSEEDYLSSIVHEAEHVKQAMLTEYQINDSGEPPAYTIGYLVSRMFEVFKTILCKNKRL